MAPPRILISRPDRIGDVVLSTPLPREIKRGFPNSFIAVLLRDYTKDIYLNNPYVDDIITFNNTLTLSGELNNINKIRDYRFTHALMLLPNQRINRILTLAGIGKRIGTGHKLFQFLTNTKSVYRNKYIPLRHESDYCLDFVRKLDIEMKDNSSEIYLSEPEKTRLLQIKAELSDGKYLVGINTTSGNSAPNWRISDYIALIKMLSVEPGIRTIVTDYDPPQELDELNVINPNKGKPLRESILNFAALDVLVSASTGPMHICAGLKVPTISIFCPMTACSPELWGPLGNQHIVVLPGEEYCRKNCPGDPKTCTFSGEGGISPDKVFHAVIKLSGINA